jgi:hypothetical protein
VNVVYELSATVDVTLLYQRYYLMALEETGRLSLRGGGLPVARPSTRAMLRARATHVRRRLPRSRIRPDTGHVGCYRTSDGLRFMIDARDSAWIEEGLVASADVYFKANAREGFDYPPHVRPIVNGNGILGPRRIERLRRLRNRPKTVDVVAVARLWGSDHEVRLFEELARLECSTRLLALFPTGYDRERAAAHRRRLERAGVPWSTTAWRPVRLWKELASARVVFARPGRHRCWPWRTVDLLAMGAAAVFDELPPPRWPVPLQEDVHVLSCGLRVPEDRSETDGMEYRRIDTTLGSLLAAPDRQEALRTAAASYFDTHAKPAAVGRYIRATLADLRPRA